MTENTDTFHLRLVICKMKIPILVVCLAVIYGTCNIYAEKSGLIEGATYDSNYISKYPNALLTKSLSRQKRGLITSPLEKIGSTLLISPLEMGLKILGFADNAIIKSALDFINFVNGMLHNRTDLCPRVEKLSIDLAKMMLQPIQTIENIMCYMFNAIGNEGRRMMSAMIPYVSKFVFKIFLPGMHMMLNSLAKTGLLPKSFKDLIDMFDVLYSLLKISGYVS